MEEKEKEKKDIWDHFRRMSGNPVIFLNLGKALNEMAQKKKSWTKP